MSAEARERVVVALPGGPEGDTIVRRAAQIAARTPGAELLAVHVTQSDGLGAGSPAHLARQRALVEALGGTYHQVVGVEVPDALLAFARGANATQLVLGAGRRGRWAHLRAPGVVAATTAGSDELDVHLVVHERTASRDRPVPGWLRGPRTSALTRGRRVAGLVIALVGLPLLTELLVVLAGHLSLATDLVVFLLLVVAVALVGGMGPALVAAFGAFLLLNYFFTPPVRLFTVAERVDLVALLAFLVVALSLSSLVDAAARRSRESLRARAEAATLFTLSGSVLRGSQPLPALLGQVRETFALDAVTLLERHDEAEVRPGQRGDDGWEVVASVGHPVSRTPSAGDAEVHVDRRYSLVLAGHPIEADDRRVLEAFAAQAAGALEHQRLTAAAAEAGSLAEVDRVRTALLSAVSHDLRTPLASAKAAVGTLRSPDLRLGADDVAELLDAAEGSLDRLTGLVENLLDMSRLQAGALALVLQDVDAEDVVYAAVASLGPAGETVVIATEDDLPEIHADPTLLERALANLVQNAVRYSPPGCPPTVTARTHGSRVELRVSDVGPGVPETDRDQIFLPFQRLGDQDNTTGVGLGLALSRGLVDAMSGTLVPEDTPGGGLTMTISLPAARPAAETRSA